MRWLREAGDATIIEGKLKMKIYISGIKEFISLKGLELATAARRARIDRYRRADDKARCLVAGLLLRQVCGVTDDSQLAYGVNGKPFLKDGGAHFSISHSGDYVALAEADMEIGVDIEKLAPYSESVAARCFMPAELEWMRQDNSSEAFFHLWTAKESVMKGSGLGLALAPETFSVLPEADCRGKWPDAEDRWSMDRVCIGTEFFPFYADCFQKEPTCSFAVPAAGRKWFMHWLPYDGHMICCAAEDAIFVL